MSTGSVKKKKKSEKNKTGKSSQIYNITGLDQAAMVTCCHKTEFVLQNWPRRLLSSLWDESFTAYDRDNKGQWLFPLMMTKTFVWKIYRCHTEHFGNDKMH